MAANLSEETVSTEKLMPYVKAVEQVKISNYADRKDVEAALRPYEAFMIQIAH